MKISEAKRTAGTLSFPSKMPSTSYDIPATACVLGAKLARIPGTICSSCYVLSGHGMYLRANAVKGMQRRLQSLAHPNWTEALVVLLKRQHGKKTFRVDLGFAGIRAGRRFRENVSGHHRWHGSGDLQSVDHFAKICEVARRTPKIKHWLPTTELGIVRRYIDNGGTIPANLVVRVSSIMTDGTHRRRWPLTSSVFSEQPPPNAHICPAPTQGHVCGSCRACWSPEVAHVAYQQH